MTPLPKRKTSKARKNRRRSDFIQKKLKSMKQQLVKSKTSPIGFRLAHHEDPEEGKYARKLTK